MTAPKDTDAADRRAVSRLRPRRGTRVHCLRGTNGLGHNLCLGLLDLSRTGACLLLSRSLPAGEEVEVFLTGPAGCRPVRAVAAVVWSAPAEVGSQVGVRFRQPIDYTGLHDMAIQP